MPTERTSVVIPAFNEGRAIGAVVEGLLAAATWHEVLVVDDGSTDDTTAQAASAGARVVRHPYNMGNGAAVKTGIRRSSGEFLLIVDADGQHQPADAARLVAHLAPRGSDWVKRGKLVKTKRWHLYSPNQPRG